MTSIAVNQCFTFKIVYTILVPVIVAIGVLEYTLNMLSCPDMLAQKTIFKFQQESCQKSKSWYKLDETWKILVI